MYKPYASESYYEGKYEGTLIPEDDQKKALIQASRHVDALTFNRIVGRGFSNLTEYQQEIIKRLHRNCCAGPQRRNVYPQQDTVKLRRYTGS